MSENKSVMESLGDYMSEIFDKDGDGIITIKEIFTVFPNSAVAIAVIFVDLLVAIAEYRVWDFGMTVTGDGWKALGFVAISAIPFYLGQIFWLYPLGNLVQKSIAVVFVGLALYTSWLFGTADLTQSYDIELIAKYLQDLTVGYVVGTLIYISVDTTVKASRQKIKAQRKAAWQTELNKIARSVLSSLRGTLEEQKEIEQEFGADRVAQAMNALGRKKPKSDDVPVRHPNGPSDARPQPQIRPISQAPAMPQQPPAPQHTLDELLKVTSMTKEMLRTKYGDRQKFMDFASGQFDYISNGNMRRLHEELMTVNGQHANPQMGQRR